MPEQHDYWGTRIRRHCRQRGGSSFRTSCCSAGLRDRWHPPHVPSIRRAAPMPSLLGRSSSYSSSSSDGNEGHEVAAPLLAGGHFAVDLFPLLGDGGLEPGRLPPRASRPCPRFRETRFPAGHDAPAARESLPRRLRSGVRASRPPSGDWRGPWKTCRRQTCAFPQNRASSRSVPARPRPSSAARPFLRGQPPAVSAVACSTVMASWASLNWSNSGSDWRAWSS